jgi:hypothetical protein
MLSNSSTLSTLPFSYKNPIGPFEMSWGFVGSGKDEMIELEFSLPSFIYIGLGLGCTSSSMCDMVVGNGGGRTPAFIGDYFEVHGDREPSSDVDLGGTMDIHLIEAKYVNDRSSLRFRRKLNTGDKWDAVLKKEPTDLVYAWCAGQYCTDPSAPHGHGDWEIFQIDLSGERSTNLTPTSDCYAGSESLCGCSELIKRGVIKSFDDCTQQAAIDYCTSHGPC